MDVLRVGAYGDKTIFVHGDGGSGLVPSMAQGLALAKGLRAGEPTR